MRVPYLATYEIKVFVLDEQKKMTFFFQKKTLKLGTKRSKNIFTFDCLILILVIIYQSKVSNIRVR